MHRIKLIISIILLSLCFVAFGQSNETKTRMTVTGKVVDANFKQPLSSVQISSADMRRAVVTEQDGTFTLDVLSENAVLIFVCDGYFKKEVNLYGRNELYVLLQAEDRTESHSETEDAAFVDAHHLGDGYASLSDALTGRFTGLKVTSKSGMPGEGSFFNYRGLRTLLGDNTPLVVVDGVPVVMDKNNSDIIYGYSNDILEPAIIGNIDRVTLLTGADAIEYGSLGSNGVLKIDTQRGTVSNTSVEFKSVEGVGMVRNSIPVLSGLDFNRYIADVAASYFPDPASIGVAFPFLSGNMTEAEKVRYGFNTDWQKEIYTPAFQSDNMLKVRGGDAVVQYLVTAGYQTSKGVVDGTGRTKLYTGGNTNINFSSKLRAFASVSFDFIESALQEQGLSPETNPMLAAYSFSPINGVYDVDANGKVIKEYGSIDPMMKVSNPVSILNNVEAKNKVYDFIVNMGMEYDILKNLKLDGKFGIYYKAIKDDIFIGGKNTNSMSPLLNGLALNTVRSGMSESINYFGKVGLKYHFAKRGHNFSAAGAYQLMTSKWHASNGSGINTSTDLYRNLSNVSSMERKSGGYSDLLNWMNGYVKADYNYKNLYYLTAAVQVDRSSSYGYYAQKCYVTPAVKAIWKLDNASFLRDSKQISDLSLNVEYSINPNSRYSNAFSSYYYQLKLLNDITGLVRSGLPNEKLGPERVSNLNLGLDFSLYGDKFTFSADVFQEQVNNMVIAEKVSSIYGYNTTYKNSGRMRTRGVEAAVSAMLIDRGFYWRVGANISMYDTRILSLGADDMQKIDLGDGVVLVNKVGEAPNSYYGFKAEGVFSTTAQANKMGLSTLGGYKFKGGDVIYSSLNGDSIIDDNDKTILGSADPKFFGGFYSKMKFKGFGLYANFSYSYGNSIYNATRRYNESGSTFRNQSQSLNRRWVTEGQVTDVPRVAYGDPAGNSRFSSRWIEDGSYLKLKELTLSWETAKRVLFLNGLKVFVIGENLFCWTKYTGSDPEFAYSYNMQTIGMDLAKVPVPRFVKLGVVLNL